MCISHRLRFAFVVVLVFLMFSDGVHANGMPADSTARDATPDVVPADSAPTDAVPAPAAPDRSTAAAAQQPGATSLFLVQRSKNRNEVHYEILLDPECRPVADKPVRNYWLRLEDGGEKKPVTLLQQAAYGFKSQRVEGRHVDLVLRALPELPIGVVVEARDDGCAAMAYTKIGGQRARLERIYVSAEDGVFRPDVKYVELFGTGEDGAPVSERLAPD